jgi:single-stranded-DNA-specific exonuclease
MKKNIVRRVLPIDILPLAEDFPPLLQRIYHARGVRSTTELDRGLDQLLPYQNLLGIEPAAECLAQAVMAQQHLMIIGDFDADGATSTALAVSALRSFGAKKINYLVPNRFEYGYGLTPEIVAVAAQSKPDVIITVDNGISSHAGVLAAKSHGIKVVITDHHLPGNELPIADAIVNPCQKGDLFASKNLAGVGVIFYVMLALRTKLRDLNWFSSQGIAEPNMAQLLDLVALGTVADLVPLDRNNRILVHHGVQRIRAGKARPGIYALFAVAGRSHERLVAADLGYAIAPRLNAAGRLTDMSLGIECLLSSDQTTARKIAAQLDALNEERRLIEREMQQQAFAELKKVQHIYDKNTQLPLGICLFDEKWHQGVIGLLAARVKEHLHRPVIAFAPANTDELKGSARSVSGLHIRDVLAAITARHPELIDKFGGHAMAAGLTLKRECYLAFCQAFDEEVRRHLSIDDLYGEIHSDGELATTDFCLEMAEQLREAGPWGQAFPEPVFDGRFKLVQQWIVGGKHLKLMLGFDDSARVLEAIAFNINLDHWPDHRLKHVHAAYRVDINEYLGRKNIQLILEQLEPA